MPSITIDVKHRSPLSRMILSAVRDRIVASKNAYSKRHEAWRNQEKDALAYLHESEIDRNKRLNREIGGKPELTTIKIPYSYGVLMMSHTYWTTVFMGRTPINQFKGRHGETEQQVMALEALMDYQAVVGEMLVPWYLWLLDGGKYGLGVVGIDWVEEYSVVSRIEEQPVMFAGLIDTGRTKKKKINQRLKGYAGNRVRNIRPFDFFPDHRVPIRFFQKGEFCGFYMELGWNQILKRADQGYYIKETVDLLRHRQSAGSGVFGGDGSGAEGERVPGSSQLQLPYNDTFELDLDKNYDERSKRNTQNSFVKCYECVIELVPKDWNLGKGAYPEKWVFTVTDKFDAVLGAQPLGANHDKFPAAVIEYEPEGYGLNARGIGEVLKSVNDTLDWLVNSHLFNVRKALNDQFVVDPSKIILSDLENPLPGGAIRMAPAAYGLDPKTALQQLPVHDVTQTHLTDMRALFDIGQRTIGVSDQLMGQIAQTGRRSATEVRTGAGFGINRLKTTSEFFSAMGWSPMTQIMVQNSQQYYDREEKFRVVGQLAQEAGEEFVMVSPEDILGFYDFVAVDGTQPIDRIAQATLWNNLLAQLRNFPEVMMRYDIGRIFEWVAQLAGLKNISRFRVQLTPDQELQLQAQQGNVVPLGGRIPSGNNPPAAGAAAAGVSSSRGGGNPNTPPPTNISGGGPSPISA